MGLWSCRVVLYIVCMRVVHGINIEDRYFTLLYILNCYCTVLYNYVLII